MTLVGVFPVLSTPFTAADTIDSDALDTEIEWIRDCGADGLTIAMVSEVLRLSDAERRSLSTRVCAAATDSTRPLPVVVSVGTSTAEGSVALAEHAESAGAAAVMAIPPLGVPLDETGLIGFFAQILEAVSLPVVVQDASGYVGDPIGLGVYTALLDEFGADRILAKPEAQPIGPRLSALRAASGNRLRVFEGLGGLALLDAHPRGVTGTMPGPEVPWAVVPLWRALSQGRTADADAIHACLASLLSLQTSLDSYVAVEKHLLVAQGVLPSARQRGPLDYQLDPATVDLAVRLLGRLRDAVDALEPLAR